MWRVREGARVRARGAGRGVPTREGNNLQSAVSRVPSSGAGKSRPRADFRLLRFRVRPTQKPRSIKPHASSSGRRSGEPSFPFFASSSFLTLSSAAADHGADIFSHLFGALLDEKLRRVRAGSRTRSRRARPRPPPPPAPTFLVASTMPTVDLAIGGLIQCMEAASLGMPFEVWKTRMGSHRSEGTLEAFRTIYRTGGVKAFWAGTGPKMFESASKVRDGRDTPGGDALNPSRPRARDPPRARRIRESTDPLSRAPGERGRGRQQMLFFVITALQPLLVKNKRKKDHTAKLTSSPPPPSPSPPHAPSALRTPPPPSSHPPPPKKNPQHARRA